MISFEQRRILSEMVAFYETEAAEMLRNSAPNERQVATHLLYAETLRAIILADRG